MIADIHCHVLPGLDDGAQSMEETLEMLQIAAKEGITHMVCTPHFKYGRKNASPETVQKRFAEVVTEAKKAGCNILFYLGNEMHYFSDFDAVIEERRIFSMNNSDFLLVEFSPNEPYRYIRNALDEVLGTGYHPILAHIERYECMLSHPEYAGELQKMGVRIQINASSVAGEVGWRIKRYTRRLIKEGLADYIATDAHSCSRRAPHIKKCRDYLYKKTDRRYADALLFENARRDFCL